ncbi:MAG TPA: YggT family protein [Ktedonobacterales bacterium]
MAYSNDEMPPIEAERVRADDPNYPTEPVQPVGPVQRAGYVPPAQPVQPVQPARPVMVSNGYRAAQIIYLILGILETLLLIRLVLKLLAANPNAGFTSLIYGITFPFVALFEGVFPTPQSNGSVLELSTILAMIVYALLAWGIVKVIDIARHNRRPTYTA